MLAHQQISHFMRMWITFADGGNIFLTSVREIIIFFSADKDMALKLCG